MIRGKDRELLAKDEQMQAKDEQLQAKDRQLQVMDGLMQVKVGQIQAMDRALQAKDGQLQGIQQALQHAIASRGEAEQLVSEFQQSLRQKDKTITHLQRTISEHERKIQQLEQQDTASRPDLPLQQSVATPQTTEPIAQKDINNMKWRKGKNAPVKMSSGAAVVHGNTAYFKDSYSPRVYSYQNIQGEDEWCQLPDNPYHDFGLAVIDGLLTSVGGSNNKCTNSLLSFTKKGWSEIFPPMPTPRSSVACVSTEQALIVAGGKLGRNFTYTEIVEVMNTNTKQWMAVTWVP